MSPSGKKNAYNFISIYNSLACIVEAGTLANGKVYVAVSDVAKPILTLGLFAGILFILVSIDYKI